MRLISIAIALTLSGCLFGTPSTDFPPSNNGTTPTSNNAPNSMTTTPMNVAPGTNNVTTNPELCGNGRLDLGETCDPCDGYTCPSGGCAIYVRTGSEDSCNIGCSLAGQQTACANDDGCCPAGCVPANDNDCSADCGNGVRDEGEACDPCPDSCESTPCARTEQRGDATTCTLECIAIAPAEGCCGGAPCAPGRTCVADACVAESCSDQAMPHVWCVAQHGEGFRCEDGQCVQPVGTCTNDGDCLPWHKCMSNLCIEPLNCYAAMGRSLEYCVHETWGSGMHFGCSAGGAAGYQCSSAVVASLPCSQTSDCRDWEMCSANLSCEIPIDNCMLAREPDVWCQFDLERLDAVCQSDGTCL